MTETTPLPTTSEEALNDVINSMRKVGLENERVIVIGVMQGAYRASGGDKDVALALLALSVVQLTKEVAKLRDAATAQPSPSAVL